MVPQTPSRYYQASPAPEDGPRAKNGQAAVPDIFELSGLAVCREATRGPWDPSGSLADARKKRRAHFCIDENPNQVLAFARRLHDAVACKRAAYRVCSHVPRVVFQAAPAWTAKRCAQTKLQAPAAAPTAAPAQSAAGPRRAEHRSESAWKSAQEPADDGRARHCRAAPPHGRGGHG